MVGQVGSLPSGMRRFNQLPLARPFILRFVAASGVLLTVVLSLSYALVTITGGVLIGFFPLIMGGFLLWSFYRSSSMLHVPLAVDMNHPFMDEEPIGNTVAMVRMSDGSWTDLGIGRVRLAEDELLGGSCLVRDDENYTRLGHFSPHPFQHKGIKKQVVILNQAIALRDLVNGGEDPIESAREREKMDTGLLDRSWFEEEKAIEIEPDGLLSKFRGE